MRSDLDDLMARLPVEAHALEGLENALLQGITRRREELRSAKALAPVRATSVGLALAIGVGAGGLTAAAALAEPQPLNCFSAAAQLAPSTLLAGAE